VCGVFGIYSTSLSDEQMQSQVYLGVAQLAHRGPDGWGVYRTQGLCLGHTRLAIFDVQGGKQPMRSDSSVLVYNGEIYNHYELRRELEAEGYSFRTHSDTEVLQKLYERYGLDCLTKLNGQFAFILWDKREQQLVVARDRLGMRPLYVYSRDEALYFSSEMKAFDAIFPGAREVDPTCFLDHGLLWNTLGSETVYKGIHSVASGTVEVYRRGRRVNMWRYYDIGQAGWENAKLNYSDAKASFCEHLQRSVQLRLRSDVPVGAYLSGGIDSSVIAFLTKTAKQDRFRTFSVEFDNPAYDESCYQQQVSDAINSQHDAVRIDDAAIRENFLRAIYHGERPVFRTAPVPLLQLSKRVRETEIVVVLTGEGADEVLFGYDTFKELKILEQWKANGANSEVNAAIAQLYPHLNHYADKKKFGLIKMYYEGFLGHFENDFAGLNIRINNNRVLEKYLNPDWGVGVDLERTSEKLAATLPSNFNSWSLLQKNSYLEIKTLLQGYLLSSQGDRMALGNSIEGRYPFLDHNLIDFVFALPDDYKLKGFSQKHLLKDSYAKVIPSSVINRPKRPYTAPDIGAFYQGERLAHEAAELLSPECIKDYSLFNERQVSRFLKKFTRGIPDNIGYRDNMLFTFILSAQACHYWIKNPDIKQLDKSKCLMDITE